MQQLNTRGLEKTNISGYFRDPKTGAILNGNENELSSYLVAREQFREFQNMKIEYGSIKDELTQIKKALGII